MPWSSSTFGWVAQSLQAMQWVRFVVGGGTLGYFARKLRELLVEEAVERRRRELRAVGVDVHPDLEAVRRR